MKSETQRKTTTRTKPTVAKEAVTPKTVTVDTKREVVQPVTVPTREEISRRAYEIYVARGKTSGHELEDWVQAEQELRATSHRNN